MTFHATQVCSKAAPNAAGLPTPAASLSLSGTFTAAVTTIVARTSTRAPTAQGRAAESRTQDMATALVRIRDEAPLSTAVVARGAAWVIPDDGDPVRLGAAT